MTVIATGCCVALIHMMVHFRIIDDRLTGSGLRELPILMLVTALSSTIGCGVFALLVRRTVRPIRAVARGAERVVDGEQGVRVDMPSSAGESAELIEHFNMLAGMIDVYERERSVLTGGIAHELRTPLTILKGRLHALKDGIIDPDRGEADRLLHQVDHLLLIVGDMATLALADARRLPLAMQPIDLGKVVRDATADMAPLIASLNLVLHEDYQPAPVSADPVRLTQIVTHLLTNAIRHAPTRSTIGIAVRCSDGRALASVADEGPGFAEQDAARLFTPFWGSRSGRPGSYPPGSGRPTSDRAASDRQASAAGHEGRSGSGLGLALCALMTKAHDGRIAATNRADRSGAVFTISLPLVDERTAP